MVQEAEDKDIKAIDEYLGNPDMNTPSMVKPIWSGEAGVEVIPPVVTTNKTLMADSSTPLSKDVVGVILPPVTPMNMGVNKLVTTTSEK